MISNNAHDFKVEEATGMKGRLRREAHHRSAGRTGRSSARAHAAASYSDRDNTGYGPPDLGVNGASYGPQEVCCSCGVGPPGPPGPPGEDGPPGT